MCEGSIMLLLPGESENGDAVGREQNTASEKKQMAHWRTTRKQRAGEVALLPRTPASFGRGDTPLVRGSSSRDGGADQRRGMEGGGCYHSRPWRIKTEAAMMATHRRRYGMCNGRLEENMGRDDEKVVGGEVPPI